MAGRRLIPIIIIVAIVFTFFFLQFQPSVDQSGSPVLDPVLSSARDLSGRWTGIVTFTERVPQCSYSADFDMNLVQNGDALNGGFNVVIREIKSGSDCLNPGTQLGFPVAGSASASAINMLISGTDKLLGSLTTDQMTLRWELCDACDSGPAIKFVGPMFLTRA